MAKSKVNSTLKLTAEEQCLLSMYRSIDAVWERKALLVLIQSLSWGKLVPTKTDRYSWPQLRRALGMPKVEAHHG